MLDFLLGWKFNLHRFRAQRAHYQGGEGTCTACRESPETTHHLYFSCPPLQGVLNSLIEKFLPYVGDNFRVAHLLDGIDGLSHHEMVLYHILMHAFFYYAFLVATRKLSVNKKVAETIFVSLTARHLDTNKSLKKWFNDNFFRLHNLERWLQRAAFI